MNDNEGYDPTGALEAKIDFKQTIRNLPIIARTVCHRLLHGQSITVIAHSLNIDKSRVKAIAVTALTPIACDYGIIDSADVNASARGIRTPKTAYNKSVAKSDMSFSETKSMRSKKRVTTNLVDQKNGSR